MCAFFLSVLLGCSAASTAAAAKPRTIRWVVAHTRNEAAYGPLMADFARRLDKRSAGELRVEFFDGTAADDEGNTAAHQQVLDGTADMGQFEKMVAQYVPAVVAPFVFRNYAHAEAVYAGPVGQKLLDGLYASSDRKLRALAFTYSGGYRVLLSKAPVAKTADLKNLRLVAPGVEGWSEMMGELMQNVGVRLVREEPDLIEDAINRLPHFLDRHPEEIKKIGFVNRTNHGMLLTAIVANEKFLSTLTGEQRRLLVEEVETLALDERKLSVGLEVKNIQLLKKKGLTFTEFSSAERRIFAAAGEAVIRKHPETYRLIQEIRSVKEKPGAFAQR